MGNKAKKGHVQMQVPEAWVGNTEPPMLVNEGHCKT
jgi:hypothetical protein